MSALRLREVEAVLPTVAQTRGPVAGHRVRLVPEIGLDAVPPRRWLCFDCVQGVAVAHAVHDLVFDVDSETARGLQSVPEGLVEGHEPVREFIRVYRIVVFMTRVGIRRRGDE